MHFQLAFHFTDDIFLDASFSNYCSKVISGEFVNADQVLSCDTRHNEEETIQIVYVVTTTEAEREHAAEGMIMQNTNPTQIINTYITLSLD
jgi:hypothetical protein